MLQFSDSDSDSDKGIRYKTDSTRNKIKNGLTTSSGTDHRDFRTKRHESHRRPIAEERFKRQSRSSSRDGKHRHKSKREKRSSTRDRSPKSGGSMKSDSSVSARYKDAKTTRSQKERSPSKRKTNESYTSSSLDSRKSSNNRISCTNDVSDEKGLEMSKEVTGKKESNDVIKETYTTYEDNLFGPSLPPHLRIDTSPNFEQNKSSTFGQSLASSSETTKASIIKEDKYTDRLSRSNLELISTKDSTSNIADSTEDICGPLLPPNIKKKDVQEGLEETTKGLDSSVNQFGPALPPKPILNNSSDLSVSNADDCTTNSEIIGPILPPHMQTKELQGSEDLSDVKESKKIEMHIAGPALPPHLQKKQELEPVQKVEIVGPALPPHLQKDSNEGVKVLGPTLPPHLRQQLEASQGNTCNEEEVESEDDGAYGPLPPGMSVGRAHVELEERALQLKIDQLGPKDDQEPKREVWMLELPEAKAASFGLGPRQFRAREGLDMSDRSSWTTTPKDAAKNVPEAKVDLKQETQLRHMKEKDKQQEEIVKSTKRTKKSLLEIHQKKLMKDKVIILLKIPCKWIFVLLIVYIYIYTGCL
ncbi:unnamed protein product [Acanthoscelides obtectus]|uniref:DUF3752 domain-containing protein n=1 Tax=Acanthoscelides obtectus TaxID=200917 RepID=A0A9P0Q7P8_ACAOB|nr:unnamed protein product [Acanthoscelides obtectus]CAK1667989.1 GPALPP motifs-containing protein 1 [Acanthoscelides obtectus]